MSHFAPRYPSEQWNNKSNEQWNNGTIEVVIMFQIKELRNVFFDMRKSIAEKFGIVEKRSISVGAST